MVLILGIGDLLLSIQLAIQICYTILYVLLISSKSLERSPNASAMANFLLFFYLNQNTTIDLALLDISLPPYIKFNIENGVDLASLIRKKFPNCKIVLLTMHGEPLAVDKIIKDINLEGFVSKNDINFEL